MCGTGFFLMMGINGRLHVRDPGRRRLDTAWAATFAAQIVPVTQRVLLVAVVPLDIQNRWTIRRLRVGRIVFVFAALHGVQASLSFLRVTG